MRKKKKVSSNVLSIVQKQRHLSLLQKVQSGRPLSAREAGELNRYENPVQKQSLLDSQARDLAKKNQARRAAQDIGVLPEVVDPVRKAATLKSLRLFCETYFPQAFYLEWSADHLKVIAKIEEAVRSGGLFAFAMPRGSGKTTLTIAAAIWAVFSGTSRSVCLIGSAVGQSLSLFQGVQASLIGNDLLLEDFPEIVFPIRALENNAHRQRGQRYKGELTFIVWGTHKIVFPTIPGSAASGHAIMVTSLDSNIRGQIHTTPEGKVLRPDLVLIDDPQTRESAGSPEQTRKRLQILNGDVLGLSGPGTKISGL
ncbi:MAG: hypothetical protein Q7T18_01230, partial [Sedimentisphaerales bacterium]|nr:hypothetical protein [Sedimentisphaerales bacterium]